jgi:Ran GTPase-activating protein (RanGAP) involved in mRNA processing and transport
MMAVRISLPLLKVWTLLYCICTSLFLSSPVDIPGPAAVADAIKNMGALLVLSLKDNKLGSKKSGEVLGRMLKGNSVLKELDLSNNFLGGNINFEDMDGFSKGISTGLAGNRAMTSLDLSSNGIGSEGATHIAGAIKVNKCVVMVVLVPFS